MLRCLRPVGERVWLNFAPDQDAAAWRIPLPVNTRFYQSGTASLAAALLAAKSLRVVSDPQVLLPAYACPDLISAVLHAGLNPCLIDFEPGTPWMNLACLKDKLSANTVAIIAVNFLGIPERMSALRDLAEDVILIEDRAQSFPEKAECQMLSDFTILSFGRGKPINLLTGGAVISRNQHLRESLVGVGEVQSADFINSLKYQLKALVYNVVITPRCYWFLTKLPFLNIGETSFKPLLEISEFSGAAKKHLPLSLEAYTNRNWKAVHQQFADLVYKFKDKGMVDLASRCNQDHSARLLRFPVLMPNRECRDRCFELLNKRGLGVSKMYPGILAKIDGLAGMLRDQAQRPHAEDFAKCLLTFPLHSDVASADVDLINESLQACFN